ncbi:isochorismatase family protein [Streptomyces sp. NP160]|uniref:isochorismatase family protein n=1 Tax=Streptomyces sp. NP160 TaxID=2586637 RepID=UPI001C574D29|nr:isochorismatase family protein [Streptomyces sp. NP160]
MTAAAQERFAYGPGTALVVVDVQVDFADPAGSLYVRGGEDVVPLVNAEVESAVAAGSPVVFTQDWHPEHTPHFAADGGIWPVHCVAGTPGAELHPDLVVPEAAPRVRKGTGAEDGYSGFSELDLASGRREATVLGDLLDAHGVERIVVVGLAGDYCVKATALDGAVRGLAVRVPLELTRFVQLADGDDERAVAEMRSAGVEVL